MATRDDDEPSYVSDAHRDIDYFGSKYIDDDDERTEFFDSFMERTGHKKASTWGPPERTDDDDRKGYRPRKTGGRGAGGESGGSYFGGRKK